MTSTLKYAAAIVPSSQRIRTGGAVLLTEGVHVAYIWLYFPSMTVALAIIITEHTMPLIGQ